MRKPNANAILLSLPADQQDQLADWLLDENLSYEKASKRVYADFNVVASREAVRTFWNNVCAGRRLRRAADAANALDSAAGGLAVDWDTRSRALLKQKHFELLAAPHIDPDELMKYGVLVASLGKADLEKDKLRTTRQKAAVQARLRRLALRQDVEKFRHRIKTDTEKALAAFYEEIKGNAAALAAFGKLQQAVEAAVA